MIQDFENSVKNTFEHFEADVNPQVWTNIQQGLHASPPAANAHAGNVASPVSKTAGIFGNAGTVITIAGIVALTTFGVWYALPGKKENTGAEVIVPLNTQVYDEVTTGTSETTTNNANLHEQVAKSADLNAPVQHHEQKQENFSANILHKEKDITKTDVKAGIPDPEIAGGQPSIKVEKPNDPLDVVNQAQQDEANKLITTYKKEPAAFIVANPVSGNAPLTVNFLNNGYAKDVSWNFGSGAENDHANQTSYTFTSPGTYTVRLNASGQDNNTYTDEVTIEVKSAESTGQSSVAEIQNVFTPNGDGYNDVFKVKSTNLSSLKAVIYNSSGSQVFQWTDPEKGWDGKLSGGSYATEGAYYYIIEAKGKDGKTYRFKGAVSLIK